MRLGSDAASRLARGGEGCWDRAPVRATSLWLAMLRCVRVRDGTRLAVDEICEKAQLRSLPFWAPPYRGLHPDDVLRALVEDGADPSGGAYVVATRAEDGSVRGCVCYARVRRGTVETDPALDFLDVCREVHLLRGCPPDPATVPGCGTGGVVPLSAGARTFGPIRRDGGPGWRALAGGGHAPADEPEGRGGALGIYAVLPQLLRRATDRPISVPTLREACANGVVCVLGVSGGEGAVEVEGDGLRWRDRYRGPVRALRARATGGGRALAWMLVPHPRGDVQVGALFPADGRTYRFSPLDFGFDVRPHPRSVPSP